MSIERNQNADTDEKDVIYKWNTIIKSSEDMWMYRGIQLKNRLKVLLISDPTTKKSAAALNVNVGHFSDPNNIPGLAHFCEHMLFLGTKKYPKERIYDQFLTKNGGSSNASTFSDGTMYYFDIFPEHFAAALDLFAQFFISPLFTINATDRELQIVNDEFKSYLWKDCWRIDQLHRSTVNPNHPFYKFRIGNKETLETIPMKMGINLREELLQFYLKWYSANLMTLVVFGKESLDVLEKMVIENFSLIEDKDNDIPSWPQHPYNEDYRGLQIYVVPIEDMRYLYMDFSIPDTRLYYKSKPSEYISYLIGHKGPGSLFSQLKAECWCNNLYSYSYCGGRGFAFYNISIDLTEKGIDHIDDIVELVFQYINLLNKEGIQKWIFDEKAKILFTKFIFQDKKEPIDFVIEYVNDIQDYPMEEILSANFHLTEWKPELIQDILSMLTPEKVRITVVGKVFESICDQNEQWYGTKYHLEKLSKEKLDRWNRCGLNEKLHLPAVNTFLPDSFDIIEPDPESNEHPTIVYDTPMMRVWYKQDDEYFLPKINTFFEFISPIANSNPLNYSLNSIFIMLFEDSLNEHSYAAELAGINYCVYDNENGFTIELNGYDSKQHIFLNYIMDKLMSFRPNLEKFEIFKDNYLNVLKNFETEPEKHSKYYLNMILSKVSWSIKDRLNVEHGMTSNNLHCFINNMLTKVYIECLVHGNASKKKAMELASIVEQKLPKNQVPLLPHEMTPMREIRLEKGNHYKFEIDHIVHSTSCTLLYFQCGLQSTYSNVLIELLLKIINKLLNLNIFKTKEQLGCLACSEIRYNNGVLGFRFVVQSDRHPNYIESRLEIFIQHMNDYICNLSDKEFENYRNSLITEMFEPPKNMWERSNIYRLEILAQQYIFDRVTIEAKALKDISKIQLYDFYKDNLSILSPNRRKLSIHIISCAMDGSGHHNNVINSTVKANNSNFTLHSVSEDPSVMIKIEDIEGFKSGMSTF